jgi:hypothetical protein
MIFSEVTSQTVGGPPGSEWSDSRAGRIQVKVFQLECGETLHLVDTLSTDLAALSEA